jgi:nitroreductase
MNVIDAIKSRASTRKFLPKEVPHEIITQILEIATWAASSKNLQPWEVVVATKEGKQQISELLLQQYHSGATPNPDLYATKQLPEHLHAREVAIGAALYGALNISRDDKEKRLQQWEKNYQFFSAPVALFFFTEKFLGESAILDCGMFMQNVMLAAEEFGLATCAQRSVAYYPEALKTFLGSAYQDKWLLTGMALGYPDKTVPENNYRTERATVNEFVTFIDKNIA